MKRFIIIFCIISVMVYAINIESPEGGLRREKIFNLRVSDINGLFKINYNGIEFWARGGGNEFFRAMVPARGINVITVSDYDNPLNKDSITFYADIPPTTLKVLLFWDTDNTDMDLHVVEPSGEECYYGYRKTKLGGSLDVDVTTGYGPEIYVMDYPNPGLYEIYIHYYGGVALTEATVYAILYEGTATEERYIFKMKLTKPDDRIYVGKVYIK
ncbi:MAG: DUF2135 domain-containing protein [Brevinematales bacterium]|nr:DUF2135 domain-containing protein [Brevinematales bacterium]